jgi:hypothetical protein
LSGRCGAELGYIAAGLGSQADVLAVGAAVAELLALVVAVAAAYALPTTGCRSALARGIAFTRGTTVGGAAIASTGTKKN